MSVVRKKVAKKAKPVPIIMIDDPTAETRSKKRRDKAAVLAQLMHQKKREEKLDAVMEQLPAGEALPVTIEPLNSTYLPFVQHIVRKGLPIEYGAPFYAAALNQAPWAKVALWDGCVVGVVICRESPDIARCVHVQALVSDVKRRKIASRLLEAIFEEAKQRGYPKNSLRVHVQNHSAIAFYKSMGYKVTETLANYYCYSKDKLEAPPDAYFMLREEAH
eukprot:TRINITY_DN91724_c0_g1_i1.p1 TRINITY_DN91724_c0_g1~~TRINITY_DN91724_c0_g1_i1.p1  ORF type:complete len:219 (-),score=44.17 TRINITY_DN91724_c0_g1_i1:199-855(-)